MTAFEFATAQRIKFGPGSIRQLGVLAGGFGRRIGLVSGQVSLEASGRLAEIETQFREAGISWHHVRVHGEPTVEVIDRLSSELVAFNPETIVGIGGGSVLDTAKALAALLANGGSALDYVEEVGRGATLSKPSLPCIAAPTTAGTGSEATRNSVIGDEAKTFKKSMRSAAMLPVLALVDPDLLEDCPPNIIATCGMDALTQLIEAYTSSRASPITDSLALQGLGHGAELPYLLANPGESEVREAMALASLLGGICLANAGLGAAHGLAAPLGAFFAIPHGVACGTILPAIVKMNVARALEQDQPGLILKYSAIFEIMAGASSEEAENGNEEGDEEEGLAQELELMRAGGATAGSWESLEGTEINEEATEEQVELALAADNAMQLAQYLTDLKVGLKIPGLKEFGVTRTDFERIIAGRSGTSMQTNPVKLEPEDLAEILESAL